MALNNAEAKYLVDHLRNKIMIATAIALIRLAKREGWKVVEFARHFQQKYLREHQDVVDPRLEQRFLSSCQNEVIDKLKRVLAVRTKLPIPEDDCETSALFGGTGDSLDWIEECTSSKTVNNNPKRPTNLQVSKKLFDAESPALKNIQFIESIMRLNVESERNPRISTSEIQALLDDDDEYESQLNHTISITTLKNELSEDSGVYSERFTEKNNSVSFVGSNVVKNSLQSTNSHQLVVQSVRCLVNYIKSEVIGNTEEVFSKWTGSLVEYACDVLKKSCEKYTGCRKMLMNLVFDILEDVWTDSRLCQHFQWEMKMNVVDNLLVRPDSCYETLEYLSEKLSYLMKLFEKQATLDTYVLLAEKLNLILNLYCSACETIKKAKSNDKLVEEKTIEIEENDITKLWQERFCQKESNEEENLTQSIEENLTLVLERFVIYTTNRFPLIAMLALQALKEVKSLKDLHNK